MMLLNAAQPHQLAGYTVRSHALLRSLGACSGADFEVRAYTRLGYPIGAPGFTQVLEPLREPVTLDGITYHRIERRCCDTADPVRLNFLTHWEEYRRQSAESIAEEAQAIRCQAIHAASNFRNALPAMEAACRLGIPGVYEVRGLWELTRVASSPEWAGSDAFRQYVELETLAARLATRVITITHALRRELVRRGIPADKITVAPNGVDPLMFMPQPADGPLRGSLGIPESVPVIGYLGTLNEYEGLADLLQAVATLRTRGWSLRCLIVGDGPARVSLHCLSIDLGLADWVIFTGKIQHSAIAAHYSLVDIATFPRRPHAVCEIVSPLKPLEAMAMGRAVVASSVEAMMELVDDAHTGLLFTKGSVESLTNAIEQLLIDNGLRLRLGREARQWVSSSRTWDMTARAISSIHREVVQ